MNYSRRLTIALATGGVVFFLVMLQSMPPSIANEQLNPNIPNPPEQRSDLSANETNFQRPIKSPADYSIVYVAGDTTDELFSRDGLLAEITQARVAINWDEVPSLDAQRPIEALIIHPSMYDAVDLDWTAQVARRGVSIVTIDMHAEESATIRGSACDLRRAGRFVNPFEDSEVHYFLAVTFMVAADSPVNQAQSEVAAFNDCESLDGTKAYSRGSHRPINSQQDLISMVSIVISHIDGVRDFKIGIDSRDIPATPAPQFEEQGK